MDLLSLVLRMNRHIIAYNLINIVSIILYVCIALWLVFGMAWGVAGVFWAGTIAGVAKLGTGLALMPRYVGLRFSWPILRRSLQFSLPAFPATIVTWINTYVDRLLLLIFLGLNGVGIFGAAARIALILSLLGMVFRNAWQPHAMRLIQDKENRGIAYRRILTYYAGIMSVVALVFAGYSPELFSILVPVDYRHGYVIVPWLAGAQVLHASASITNIGIVISEKTFANSIAAWSGALTNIAFGLIFIPLFGIWGTAIGSFLAELIFTGLMWRFSVRQSDVEFDMQTGIRILLCFTITSVALLLVSQLVSDPMHSIVLRTLLLLGAMLLISMWTIDRFARQQLRLVLYRLQNS
ncbi:polysaccharide biosynthesis C-terminal domain-containing protein [Chloroflexi bacterium TSY]|nr:polysaccharide biosynthesis C-terminal domain-containing protein [Chloroflexi bacterium TSY]